MLAGRHSNIRRSFRVHYVVVRVLTKLRWIKTDEKQRSVVCVASLWSRHPGVEASPPLKCGN